MANSINLLEKYLLEHYDRPGGTMGAVDPSERAAFYDEELRRLQPGLPALNGLSDDSKDVERLFRKWKSRPKFQAAYLSGLKLEEFKTALLGQRESSRANAAAMRIGDDRISARFNSQGTVNRARKSGDIPREGMAFKANDPSRPVRFTIGLESVNAFVHTDVQENAASTILRPSTVYIVPQGYSGRVPPTEQEIAGWYRRTRWPNMSSDPGKYFFAIVAGATGAKSFKVSDKGYADITYDVEMPPGSYEVHAVSGEFKGSDFDNFDISVTGFNTEVDVKKKPTDIRLAPEGETKAAGRRIFVRDVVEMAKRQGGDEGVKGKRVGMVFVLDHSGSMGPAAQMVRDCVNGIVGDLTKSGAREVLIGLVVFNDTQSIDTLMPLTAMNDESVRKLRASIDGLKFDGGTEPVGEAALQGMSVLEGSTADPRLLVLVTDRDGLNEDRVAAPVLYDEVVRKVFDSGIVVNLQNSDNWLMNRFLGRDGRQSMLELASGRLVEYLRMNPGLKPEDRKKVIDAAVALAQFYVEVSMHGVGNASHSLETAKKLLSSCDRRLAADVMKDAMWNADYAADRERFVVALDLALAGDADGIDFLNDLPKDFEFRQFDNRILEKVMLLGEPQRRSVITSIAGSYNCWDDTRLWAAKTLAEYDRGEAIEVLREMVRGAGKYMEAFDLALTYDPSLKADLNKDIMGNQHVNSQDRFGIALRLAQEGDKDALDFLNDPSYRLDLSFLDVPTVEKLEPLGIAVKGALDGIVNCHRCRYDVRMKAAEIIGKSDPDEARKLLEGMLFKYDVPFRDRVEILLELVSMGDKVGSDYFVTGLPKHPDLHTVDMSLLERIASVGVLAKETLAVIVRHPHCDIKVRIEAAKTLAKHDKGAAVENLKVVLGSENNYAVFVKAFASIDEDQAKAFFRELFLNAQERAKRVEIALVLAPLEDRDAIDFLRREAVTSPRIGDIVEAFLSGGKGCLDVVRNMVVNGMPDEKTIVTGALIDRLFKAKPESDAATEFMMVDILLLVNLKLAIYTLKKWCQADNPAGVRLASAIRLLPYDNEAATAALAEISKSDDAASAAKAQEVLKGQSKQ